MTTKPFILTAEDRVKLTKVYQGDYYWVNSKGSYKLKRLPQPTEPKSVTFVFLGFVVWVLFK